jgi:hypothetical protein
VPFWKPAQIQHSCDDAFDKPVLMWLSQNQCLQCQQYPTNSTTSAVFKRREVTMPQSAALIALAGG